MTHSTRYAPLRLASLAQGKRSGQVRTSIAVVIVLFAIASSAGAQAKPTTQKPAQPRPTQPKPTTPARPRSTRPMERIYISINGAYQTGGDSFGETATFTRNAETGTFTTDYSVQSGPALNVSVGANLWRSLGVGVGVTRY